MYRLENTLMALTLHLCDRLNLIAEREIRRSLTDASALVLLWNNGQIPIRLLATTLGVTHPAAVQLADRLCADGLVERLVGKDRRRRLVTLTRKGRRRVRAFLEARVALARRLLARLGAADRVVLQHLVDQLLAASATDRATVDHLCRCCDEQACPPDLCPAERQVAGVSSPLTEAW